MLKFIVMFIVILFRQEISDIRLNDVDVTVYLVCIYTVVMIETM